MKRKYIIWGGGVVVLLVVGLWVALAQSGSGRVKQVGLMERETRNTVSLKLTVTNGLAGAANGTGRDRLADP